MKPKILLFTIMVMLYFTIIDFNKLNHSYFDITFFRVDVWDAIFVKTPHNKTIIIDWWKWNELNSHLSTKLSFFEHKIDLVILTHPESDHIWWLIETIKKYDIWEIWLPNTSFSSDEFTEFKNIISSKSIKTTYVNEQTDIKFDENLYIDIFNPGLKANYANVNNNSIVLKMIIGKSKTSVLFTWDIEKKAENDLTSRIPNLQSDILKSPHHWSDTSSSTGFLLAVQPKLAVIWAYKNSYWHPDKDILKRYTNLGIKYIITWESWDYSLHIE